MAGSATYCEKMITRAQVRAARALMGWTQSDLGKASGVSEVAIKNLERGVTDPRVSTISNIQAAFDQAGVIFLDVGRYSRWWCRRPIKEPERCSCP
jgi:transcriptional regulator with XRE-family HTH domain